jgi:hypothetical protein
MQAPPRKILCRPNLSKFGASSVTVVGYSLGGALALLDGIYFCLIS